MKRTTFVAIITTFILILSGSCFAQENDDQTGQMGHMMSGQGMMGHQGMSDQGTNDRYHKMNRCPMGKGMMNGMPMSGMMGKSMVATQDGGVVIMIGNKLYKYDQKLKLEKETEIPVDYKGLKNMMTNMQNMGMGMMAPSESAEEK